MGEHTIRSFCGLGIFVFFLYFMKVSSAPSASTQNIIDVMTVDQELASCKVPIFLYDNNITRDCHNVTYPDEKSDEVISKNTFLCMTFYDTIYKVCQSNQLQNPVLNNVTTFYTYIQKLIPKKNEEDQTKFCENIRDLKFSYKKLKSLSHINLNNSHVCYSACFSVTEDFIPLCAILPWSKSIDEFIAETSKIEQKKAQSNNSSTASKTVVTDSNIKVTDINSNEAPKNKSAVAKNTETAQETPPVDNKLIIEKSNASVKQTINIDDAPPADKQVQKDVNADQVNTGEVDKVSVNKGKSDDPKNLDDTNGNVEKIKIEENEDIKTSTISENTEDHENSANQDDWDDDKPINDPNEVLDQAVITAADPGQNMPEPSEQRDSISPYHSMRTDDESHFFTYFTIVSLISVAAYIGYHNKQKILAIVLEGRRSRSNRGRRRPSTANYRKLDCTLEEAVTSQCNANVTHVIY